MKKSALTFLLTITALCSSCDRIKDLLHPAPSAPQVPAAPVPELLIIGVPEKDQIALRDLLKVRGLLRQGDDYVVMINTQLVRKGESLVISCGDKVWKMEILSVDIDRVRVRAVAQPSAPPGLEQPAIPAAD
ncbi:MAG TPA: hypothetical protein EYP62_02675 [Kiritimatiellae bacterium]|nr:hypothetical protein [Kiritimatiellia bacterium]